MRTPKSGATYMTGLFCGWIRTRSRGRSTTSIKSIKSIKSITTIVVALALVCSAFPAWAIIRDVEPGTLPALKADEALLVVGVDTNTEIEVARFVRTGQNSEMKSLHSLGKGQNLRLLVAPAGRYRWSTVELREPQVRFRAHKDDEVDFEVRAGRLNYAGDLIFRKVGDYSATLHISNRSLAVIDWLRAQHSAPFEAFAFDYVGRYPDPFPAFYRKEIAQKPPSADRVSTAPASGKLPLAIESLWRPSHLSMIELNPSGDLLAKVVEIERDGVTRWAVELVDLSNDKVFRLTEEKKPIARLDWADDRRLIVSLDTEGRGHFLVGFNIVGTPEKRAYDLLVLMHTGRLIATIRDEPGHILFQAWNPSGNDRVFKLNFFDSEWLRKYRYPQKDRLDRGVDRASQWFADRDGQLRMATAYNQEGDYVLLHGAGDKFRHVLNLSEENDFRPQGLSADGNLIYGTAEHGRGQRDLVEFDPATGKITRTLLSIPGTDIVGPLFNSEKTLVGAYFYRDGLVVSEYFDKTEADVDAQLRRLFPDRAAVIVQRDERAQHFLVAVGGADQATTVHMYDRTTATARMIEQTRPWLSKTRLASSRTLRVKSRDGFEVEAYLTLPNTQAAKHPLIVLPHGGPIGIRDDRLFDPEIQFLASLGYAVLQVNFRGSHGFGTAFREAGRREYGGSIEDDIDTALNAALAQFPLDATRMCAMGASYGGYSALVSSIRWPQRFRCAISMFGVSDRALFFTASDSARSAETRKIMEAYMGDPNKAEDLDEMLKSSPLYRYRELDLPVMLVHGTEDIRVDYEHTRRLLRMLNLAERPPVTITLEGEAHGIEKAENRERTYEAVAGFLRAHLGDPLATP